MTRSSRITVAVALLATLPAATASGAGFEYPDLGASALGRAGAFTATADDPTAIAYNPAGIANLDGLHLLLEGSLALNEVSFRRRENPYTRCNASGTLCGQQSSDTVPFGRQPGGGDGTVLNEAGWFPAAFLAASYSMPLAGEQRLGFALGVYGPPAIGRYQYPAPNLDDSNFSSSGKPIDQDPRYTAPQRYALIDSDILIAYPGATVSYRHSDWFSAGVTVQYVYFSLKMSQAIQDSLPFEFDDPEHPDCDPQVPGTCGPDRMFEEDPYRDSVVQLDVTGRPVITGVLGVLVKPHPRLQIGASWRPGYSVDAPGTLKVQLSKFARDMADAEVLGDQASLQLQMPHIARLGVRYELLRGLDVEVDGVYEGWSSVDKMTVTPDGMRVKKSVPVPDETAIDPIVIQKNWVDSWSGRLGVEYRLPYRLPLDMTAKLRGGLLYESGAIPLSATSVDFPNWDRYGETVGLSLGSPLLEGTFGMAFLQQPNREVDAGTITGAGSDPGLKPFVVGNGSYSSSYTIAMAGLRGQF